MENLSLINSLIQKGIFLLRTMQNNNGNFTSYSSYQKDFFHSEAHTTTFYTACILQSISHLEPQNTVKSIQQKAIDFLIQQQKSNGSYNYWDRYSDDYQKLPYPDDLDDTALSLAAIFLTDPSLIDGKILSSFTNTLISLESSEGGPYFTWITDRSSPLAWKDIDLAVNTNIAYFLSLQGVSLPNITAMIKKSIESQTYTSTYYEGVIPIYYFLSRVSLLPKKNILIEDISKTQIQHLLDQALVLSSLIRLHAPITFIEKHLENLLLLCEKQNIHQTFPFVREKIQGPNTIFFSGCPAFTLASILEALSLYKKNLRETKINHITPADTLYTTIVYNIRNRFFDLDPNFAKTANTFLDVILERDKHKTIGLIGYISTQSFSQNLQKKIPTDLFVSIGVANFFGWMAYTIYDDFFDQESQIQYLPLANLCLREVTKIYENILPKTTGFCEFFHAIIDTLDTENLLEVTKKRAKKDNQSLVLPPLTGSFTFEKTANKSLGHALGPLCVLFFLGYNEKSSEVLFLKSFFQSYIALKQLCDDLHDWQQDLCIGNITPVISLLLQDYAIKKNQKIQLLYLDTDMAQLQELFWFETLEKIVIQGNIFAKKAREHLKANSIIEFPQILEKLLLPLETSLEEVKAEQIRMIEFLESYEKYVQK